MPISLSLFQLILYHPALRRCSHCHPDNNMIIIISKMRQSCSTGKFLERSFFVLTAAGIFLLLLEGGQVHHDWAKILLLIISIALLLSLIFSVALLYSSDILHHRFWKCPNCGGELPLLTMPRTFLTKQRFVQNPDLYDLCVKKQIRCVRLPGSNLLIPSRCPHCGEKFWKYKKRNRQ